LVVSQPRVLLVAPMSGHFATLLRGTAQTLLVDHDVYITDWHNARDVGLRHGSFDFDDFIEHLITFLQVLGPGTHVVGVCQPRVAVLATAAIMAEDGDPAQPRSMTLMAGPIDTRVNPTEVNRLATSRPIEWFESHLIGIVPLRYGGALRRVYPGFVQLAAFMSMNLDRHIKAQIDLFCHLANGDDEKAEAIRSFYDEYCAVMDLPAEFYLQTVRTVFQEHALPLGKFEWRGRLV
jgi:poly(3-hydroxybutyrate) depolymerase